MSEIDPSKHQGDHRCSWGVSSVCLMWDTRNESHIDRSMIYVFVRNIFIFILSTKLVIIIYSLLLQFPTTDGRLIEMVRLRCPFTTEPNWHGKFFSGYVYYMLIWKESLNSDGHQFHKYQQNEQSLLILAEHIKHKKDHNIWR